MKQLIEQSTHDPMSEGLKSATDDTWIKLRKELKSILHKETVEGYLNPVGSHGTG